MANNILVPQANGQWAIVATTESGGVHTLNTTPAPGSTTLAADGSLSNPGYAFQAAPSTGILRTGGNLGLAVAGALAMLAGPGGVNYLQAAGGASTFRASLAARGADTNVGMNLDVQAAGDFLFTGGSFGSTAFRIVTAAGTVNYMQAAGGATGAPPSLFANGTDANIGFAVIPKAAGALMAAVPDNTAAGGNARGANATDWQTSRVLAARVASGASAVIGGGADNTASGANSVVAGGQVNAADGAWAWVPGGARAVTRATSGRGAWANGRFAADGDAQAGEFVLRRSTADATPTVLTTDGAAPGAANQIVLPNNGLYFVSFFVAARQPATGDCGTWFPVRALVKRGANAAATVVYGGGANIAPEYGDAAPVAGWKISTGADTTNGALAITATGEAAKTIQWVVRAMTVENVG